MPSLSSSLTLMLILGLSAAPTPMQKRGGGGDAAAVVVVEDPAVNALALKIYSQMRAGKVDSKLLTEAMQKALAPEVLSQNKPMFDQIGNPTTLVFKSGQKRSDGTLYIYLATFPTAELHVTIFMTTDNKVGGFQLEP